MAATMASSGTFRVGLISDTHGLLRPEALDALRASDCIVHAGDIGDPRILEQLAGIAPVTAVRGNNDRGPWAAALRETEVLQLGMALIYVIHNVSEIDVDPAAAGFHVVVAGHTHQPRHEIREGVHFVNPGSAGPRRFRLPVSIGSLTVCGSAVTAQLTELKVGAAA